MSGRRMSIRITSGRSPVAPRDRFGAAGASIVRKPRREARHLRAARFCSLSSTIRTSAPSCPSWPGRRCGHMLLQCLYARAGGRPLPRSRRYPAFARHAAGLRSQPPRDLDALLEAVEAERRTSFVTDIRKPPAASTRHPSRPPASRNAAGARRGRAEHVCAAELRVALLEAVPPAARIC